MKIATTKRSGLTLALLASACAGVRPPTASTTAIDPCRDATTWQDDLRIVLPSGVLAARGLYIKNTCDGTTQVTGTELLIRRSEDSSSTALARMLKCGGSRVLLAGGERSRDQSPSSVWLPDGWVEISVRSHAENVLVTLSADSVPKNIELLRHAVALASARTSTRSD
jgi:hypothetical protein